MRAVVGLGNPGDEYAETRHNAGFVFIRRIAKAWGVRMKKIRHGAKIVLVERDGESILLAMPQTYMNRSGESLSEIVLHYGLSPEQALIIYDDFELPLGEIRIRPFGSAGSHLGMASVLSELRTRSVPRMRIGIGPLPEGADAAEFVLAPFADAEAEGLRRGLEKAEKALGVILDGDLDRAMTLYN